jgi:hypothetical protein
LYVFLVEGFLGDDIGSVCEDIDVVSLFFPERKRNARLSRAARASYKFMLWLICGSGRIYDWRPLIVGVSSAVKDEKGNINRLRFGMEAALVGRARLCMGSNKMLNKSMETVSYNGIASGGVI